MTNRTTMSFATTGDHLKEDALIYSQHCSEGYPHDYALFRHLLTQKHRKLVRPIPTRSTHEKTSYLAPLID